VLKSELGVDTELRIGPTGSFIVQVDGNTVAQKNARGFPTEDEIVKAVRAELG
jgi:selenoprotein W-related protein